VIPVSDDKMLFHDELATLFVFAALTVLTPCTEDEVRRSIMAFPTKSCSQNPVSTFLLREFIEILLPYNVTGI